MVSSLWCRDCRTARAKENTITPPLRSCGAKGQGRVQHAGSTITAPGAGADSCARAVCCVPAARHLNHGLIRSGKGHRSDQLPEPGSWQFTSFWTGW